MTTIASIESDCFIQILYDEGFRPIATDGTRVLLEKPGHDPALILRTDTEFSHSEIMDWLHHADVTLARFTELRLKHCPP